MNPTPEQAHGWLSFFNRLAKTKFGSGVIGFAVASGIAVGIFFAFIKGDIAELKEEKKALESDLKAANSNCIQVSENYFKLYMEQQEAMRQAEENNRELKMMKESYYQKNHRYEE